MSENLIILSVTSKLSEKFFELKIKELDNNFFLTLKILDRIIDKKIYYEKTDLIIDLMFDNAKQENYSKDNVKQIIKMTKELEKKHKYFNHFKFSLEKKKKPKYDELIDIVKNYKLEQSEEYEEERNSLILDGFSVTLKIKRNKKTNKFIINTPTKKSHPIIIKFIIDSLKIFRENNIISNNNEVTIGF